MKQFFIIPLAALLLLSASTTLTYNNGIAGYTGAGGGQTCNYCHSGGGGTGSVTIASIPEFSAGLYKPDSVYRINIQMQATGYSKYGFDCEILDSNYKNAGTITTTLVGSGVKSLYYGSRLNAVHTTPRNGSSGTTFSFYWTAPSEGKATIYVAGNAVNGNNNTTGDKPLSPVSLDLYPQPAPVDTTQGKDTTSTVSVREIETTQTQMKLYPNPARVFTNLSYTLRHATTTQVVIYDLKGQQVGRLKSKQAHAGTNTEDILVADLPVGTYYLQLEGANLPPSRRLLIVY